MKKLLLVMTLGLSFALAGCSKKGEISKIEYTEEQSIDNFNRIKNDGGFYIKYNCYNDAQGYYTFEYAANKDLYMYGYSHRKDPNLGTLGQRKFYTDLSDSTKSVATVIEGDNWEREEMYYANTDGITKEDLEHQQIEFILSGYIFSFTQENYFDSYTLTKTTAKVVGRKCDKFTYEHNGETATFKYTSQTSIYIDQELGFCLGVKTTTTLIGEDGKKEKIDNYFMCSKFKLGYDIVIPEKN